MSHSVGSAVGLTELFCSKMWVLLTWRRPVSAARGFSAGPPSWTSRPRTLVFFPPALCTAPPNFSSSARGVARAAGESEHSIYSLKNAKKAQERTLLRTQNTISYLFFTISSVFKFLLHYYSTTLTTTTTRVATTVATLVSSYIGELFDF